MLTIIGGALYTWQIYTLIVMLFYRETMFAEGDNSPVILDNFSRQNDSKIKLDETSDPEQEIWTRYKAWSRLDPQTSYSESSYYVAKDPGFFLIWEVALFLVLIIDYQG